MLEDNNTWQNKFNPSELENEEWLEPSEGLLDAIEEEIYGKEEQKKVLPLFPLMLIGFLVLVLGAMFLMKTKSNGSDDLSANQKELPEILIGKEGYKKGSLDLNDDTTEENKITKSETVTETNDSKIQESEDYISKVKKNASSIPTRTESSKPPTQTRFEGQSISAISNSFSKGITQKIAAPELEAQPNIMTLTIGNLDNLLQKKAILSRFDGVPTSLQYPVMDVSYRAMNFSDDHSIEVLTRKVNLQQIYFGAGMSTTQYILNSNFSSAVEPADFVNSWGYGFAVNFGYKRKVHKNFCVFVETDYDRTTFTSGHNSSFTHIDDNENDPVVLTMATPLGFMEGSALIRSSNSQSQQKDLILDLHNEHSYSSFAVNVGLGYEFFTQSPNYLELIAGIGVQQLFGLDNTLTEVNSSDPLYNASSLMILADQETINKLIPRSLVGFELGRDLSGNTSLGLSYRWHYGLKPIHQQGDLSTALSRHNLYFQLKRRF